MAVDKSTPILIVDDYRTMIRIIRNQLTQLGFDNLDDAPDGCSALAKLKERQFGLVISDWNLAPMSGIELLQQMRADPALEALPFLMITARNRDDRVAEARAAGVNGHVVKPFNADTLGEQITHAMDG
jgi:two-component system, chemotaxis family, chemotaxis protein CheY